MKKKELRTKLMAGLAAFAVLGTAVSMPPVVQTVYADDSVLPTETNVSFSTARPLMFGSSMAGTLLASDNKRYYKFSLADASRLNLGFEKNNWDWLYIYVYDASQTQIYYGRFDDKSFTLNYLDLTGGDYYLMVCADRDTTFSFVANMDSMGESFVETQDSNNDLASDASPISLKKKYKGVLAQNDDVDYFKFDIPSAGKLTVNLTNSTNDTAKYVVYDQSLNMVYTNSLRSGAKASDLIPLNKGAYYLAIAKENINSGHGSYTFTLDFIKKITAAPKIKSLKSPYSRRMDVKWSKVAGASGYEVWYSRKSNFKSGVTKLAYNSSSTGATIYDLAKGEKYYVKVRAYEEIGGVRQYGKWSAKKSVVIKK